MQQQWKCGKAGSNNNTEQPAQKGQQGKNRQSEVCPVCLTPASIVQSRFRLLDMARRNDE